MQGEGQEYMQHMLNAIVKKWGVPDFQGEKIQLPSNLNFDEQVVDFLKYGFHVSYMGDIPTPTTENHASAHRFPNHVKAYVARETATGALLRPFKELPFHPLCQIRPLLTRPKKYSDQHRIIMDLSWLPPPR